MSSSLTAEDLTRYRFLMSVMLVAGLTPRVNAASFDCRVASRQIEILICQSPDLSQLDEALSAAYLTLRDRSAEADRGQIKDGQRAWLVVRNHCGDEQCVHDASIARLKQLNASIANSEAADPVAHIVSPAPNSTEQAEETPPPTVSVPTLQPNVGKASAMSQTAKSPSWGAYIAAIAGVFGIITIVALERRRRRTSQDEPPPSVAVKDVPKSSFVEVVGSPHDVATIASTANSQDKAFCRQCGERVRQGSRFCTNCGARK